LVQIGSQTTGEAQTFTQGTGYTSVERTRIVMSGIIDYADDGSPIFYDGYQNFGEGFTLTGNTLNSPDGGWAAATGTCTSDLNPFDYSGVTEDCWNAIKADVKDWMLFEQNIL
jgi:hypothetical protein